MHVLEQNYIHIIIMAHSNKLTLMLLNIILLILIIVCLQARKAWV